MVVGNKSPVICRGFNFGGHDGYELVVGSNLRKTEGVGGVSLGVSKLRLNGHPVEGNAVLEPMDRGQKQLWAAITISAGSPTHRLAQQAVLANSLEMTLEGEALNPMTQVHFRFRAKGQLVNGRVGKDIKADFKCTELVVEETP